MGGRTNQLQNTKWVDVQINHRIQNGRTYKSNQLRDTKWANVQINHGNVMGRHISQWKTKQNFLNPLD